MLQKLRSSLANALLVFSCVTSVFAQEVPKPADPLATSQKQLADQINRLETLLLRSADIEALDNPTRAALLQQAVQLSKQAQLSTLLDRASQNLNSNQLSEAIENQKSSREALKRLLELLQSENREKRVREQRDQVRRWIEEADRLLRMQSSLRGRTEGGQEAAKAAEDQARLSNKAEQIAEDLDGETSSAEDPPKEPSDAKPPENNPDGKTPDGETPDGKTPDGKTPDGKTPDGKTPDGKTPDGKTPDGKTPDGKTPDGDKPSPDQKQGTQKDPAESNPSQGDRPGQSPQKQPSENSPGKQPSQQQPGQQQPSQQQPGQPSEKQSGEPSQGEQNADDQQQQTPQQPQTPTERAQEQIEQAQQRMKEAEEALKKAERDDAVQKQREAEENLKQAIQNLEEILKQLREEEIKRSLETLSTRLRRMLDMQNKILEETQRLNQIAGEEPDRQILARASTLARDQQKVAAEGERALLLLKEEGSSAAFPEALVQVNQDAVSVANRLEAGDVGKITLVVETDIVQALEEMVEALAKIKKENEDNKEKGPQMQQPGGGQGDPQTQPLINKLAELRLIRTLQLRVNKRTTTLSQMLDNPADAIGQAKAKDLVEQLQDLGKRQESIESVTRKTAADDKAP